MKILGTKSLYFPKTLPNKRTNSAPPPPPPLIAACMHALILEKIISGKYNSGNYILLTFVHAQKQCCINQTLEATYAIGHRYSIVWSINLYT